LKLRGEIEELPALQASLVSAQARTDVPITASCLCRTSAQAGANAVGSIFPGQPIEVLVCAHSQSCAPVKGSH
jgi:hypothetical protein